MRKAAIILATSSLATLAIGTAPAQQNETAASIAEEIRVVAPRMVREERLPAGRGQRVSLTYSVTYTDLDLTQTADVRELESRVSTAASEVCEQLAQLFPEGDPSPEACERRATDEAMSEVDNAVDAAIGSG